MFVQQCSTIQRPKLPSLREAIKTGLPKANTARLWPVQQASFTTIEHHETLELPPIRHHGEVLLRSELPDRSEIRGNLSPTSLTESAQPSRSCTPSSSVISTRGLPSPSSDCPVPLPIRSATRRSFAALNTEEPRSDNHDELPAMPESYGWWKADCHYAQAIQDSTSSFTGDELLESFFSPPTGTRYGSHRSRPKGLIPSVVPKRNNFKNQKDYEIAVIAHDRNKKHTANEGQRRERHFKLQSGTHSITPDLPNDLGQRDPAYAAEQARANRTGSTSRQQGKDEQLFSAIYMFYLGARVILSERERRMSAEAAAKSERERRKFAEAEAQYLHKRCAIAEARVRGLEVELQGPRRKLAAICLDDRDVEAHHRAATPSHAKRRHFEDSPRKRLRVDHGDHSSPSSRLPPSPSLSPRTSFTSRPTVDSSWVVVDGPGEA